MVLLGVDWKMLMAAWSALIGLHLIFRDLIRFSKLLSCWMRPRNCGKNLFEGFDAEDSDVF